MLLSGAPFAAQISWLRRLIYHCRLTVAAIASAQQLVATTMELER